MKRLSRLFIFGILLTAGWLLAPSHTAMAQQLEPRFGLGFNGMLSTEDGLGLGLRTRVSAPVNNDLSFAVDLGLTGFVLRGRDDATYVFDPTISAIVTLPIRGNRAPYAIGGLGAYVSFDDDDTAGGPTIHGGFGYVQTLSETTLFYEIDPALIIGEESVDLVLPVRVGIIF